MRRHGKIRTIGQGGAALIATASSMLGSAPDTTVYDRIEPLVQ
jgi:hypothetical protein